MIFLTIKKWLSCGILLLHICVLADVFCVILFKRISLFLVGWVGFVLSIILWMMFECGVDVVGLVFNKFDDIDGALVYG